MYQYWILESRDGESWRTACHPNGGNIVHPFDKLDHARRWIASMPEWYARINKRLPPKYHQNVPQYKIMVREVTDWREFRDDAEGGEQA